MNQDNVVCYTLTTNIINEYDYEYGMICYGIVYDRYSLRIKLRLRCYIVDDLGTPQSSNERTCHEWLMFRSRCVKRILI